MFAVAASLLVCATIARAEPGLDRQLKEAEKNRDTPAVFEICRRMAEAEPGNVEALRKLVRASLELGDPETTRRYLETLKEKEGADDSEALYIEGELLAREGKDEEAAEAWKRVLQDDPENTVLLAKLAGLFRAAGDDENALVYYERLLGLRSSALDNVVVAEAAIARRDWNTLTECTATLKSKFAANGLAKRKAPVFERVIGAMMKIADLDERIAAPNPSVWLFVARGLNFRDFGLPKIALPDARRVLKMEPGTLWARMAYTLIASPLRSEHKRIEAWGIDPDTHGKARDSFRFLKRLADLEARIRESGLYDAAPFLERAALLSESGQGRLALRDIDAALKLAPDNPLALRMKARDFWRRKETSKAVPYIERALASKPDDLESLDLAVEIFAEQGEFRRAIDACDAILAQKKDEEISRKRIKFYEILQQPVPEKP